MIDIIDFTLQNISWWSSSRCCWAPPRCSCPSSHAARWSLSCRLFSSSRRGTIGRLWSGSSGPRRCCWRRGWWLASRVGSLACCPSLRIYSSLPRVGHRRWRLLIYGRNLWKGLRNLFPKHQLWRQLRIWCLSLRFIWCSHGIGHKDFRIWVNSDLHFHWRP